MEMLGRTNVTTALGTTLAWTEMGSGPPLVLLHGMGDSHRTWRAAAPILAQHHRVIMLDLPGHGLSARPDAPYTLDWYAKTVLAWFDAVGIDRANVVGHSFGGGVAQIMVLLARERIDRLALVAAGGLGREVSAGLRFVSIPPLSPRLVQPFMGIGTRAIMHLAAHPTSKEERRELDRAAWLNCAPGTGLAFRRTVTGCIDIFGQNVQTWDRIEQVQSLPPIGLFWGERDRILPVQHGYAAKDRIIGATFAAYAGVGHFPQLQVGERFANDLVTFFDRSIARPEARIVPAARSLARRSFRRRWGARFIHAMKELITRIVRVRPAPLPSSPPPACVTAAPLALPEHAASSLASAP